MATTKAPKPPAKPLARSARAARAAHAARAHSQGADELVAIRLDSLAPGGDAVGRQVGGLADGRATFVALGAPNERVRVRVVRQKARVAWAELAVVDEPSPARVTPPCPFFGRCGGCQWQHVDLAAQRAAKRAIVARALGLELAEVSLIAPSATGQGYRDRVRLAVGPRGALGFRARRSHDVVDVDRCLLLGAELATAMTAIRASASGFAAGTEIDLQAGRDGVHVAVRAPVRRASQADSDADAVDAVAVDAGGDAGAWLDEWRAAGVVGVRVVEPGHTTAAGAPAVDVSESGGPSLRVPAGGFAQVGAAATAALVGVVIAQVGPAPGAVLELYAGSGTFTRHLIGRATRVIACDADTAAVARGRAQVPQASWLPRPPRAADADADTATVAATAVDTAVDLALVDPPREGLDAENLAAAVRARRRIVYVSCDPQTLGRDVGRLAAAGFALRAAVALDLMPHTFHVEVVATFDRI